MKRIGEKQALKVLNERGAIYFNDWFTLNAGYRIVDIDGFEVGYITYTLFEKLFNSKQIKLRQRGYSFELYEKA